MLKGVAQRDVRWHKRHEKKLAKYKARRKVYMLRKQDLREQHPTLNGITKQDALEAAQRNKELGRELGLWKRLWVWFISLYGIVKVRKVAHYFTTKYA